MPFQDKYVLLSLVMLCVVCVWHAVVTVFCRYGSTFLQKLERDVFIAFVMIYIICHIVFIFWLYFVVSVPLLIRDTRTGRGGGPDWWSRMNE